MAQPDARILIVDDIQSWRELLEMIIALELGYTCMTASSYEEAIDVLTKQPIDLAVLDIRLLENGPGDCGGLAILKWLANNQSGTKVIMVTGYPTVERARVALSAGAVAFLCKMDFEPDTFVALVRGIVQSSYQ